MKPSPLQFARAFEQLKGRLRAQPAGDLRLLLLVEFWPTFSEHIADTGYRSYLDEYVQFLLDDLIASNLDDLLPDELKSLLEIALALQSSRDQADALAHGIDLISTEAARKLFYVGATEEGIGCLTRAHGLGSGGRQTSRLPPAAQDGSKGQTRRSAAHKMRYPELVEGSKGDLPEADDVPPPAPSQTEIEVELSEIDALRQARLQLVSRAADISSADDSGGRQTSRLPPAARDMSKGQTGRSAAHSKTDWPVARKLIPAVSSILRDWEIERDAVSFEEARCLFVEKNSHSDQARGRLRSLQGSAEYRRKGAKTDEVTFANQLKAPDDPFVGAVYDSLKAVGRFLGRSSAGDHPPVHTRRVAHPLGWVSPLNWRVAHPLGWVSPLNRHIRARYTVAGSDHTFTGDSIGLAAGLVAYTQLLKPEVLKQERLIASEAAFTGGVDEHGRLLPVNDKTLHLKIERAFFAPVRYLVLPEDNLETARRCVAKLRRVYPRRRLRLVGATTLGEVIENRNVVRAEKVCLVPYVARKTLKYSRATRIQVPILLALLYALVCLVYPKAWLGFDWNPQHVRLTDRGFQALNQDSVTLWEVGYECTIDTTTLSALHRQVGDLDGDGKNEVAFIPSTPKSSPGECSRFLHAYDHDGAQLFRRRYAIYGEYPGDTSLHLSYNPHGIAFANNKTGAIILTAVNQSFPGRAHILLWDISGDQLGWYINAGFAAVDEKHFSGAYDSGFVLLGINNAMGCAALFVLPRDSVFGASPPYTDNLKKVRRGNQLAYILFPPSDLCRFYQLPYSGPCSLELRPDQTISVVTSEDQGDPPCALFYFLDRELRVVEVKADDLFIVRRNELADSGEMPPIDWPDYLAHMRDAVTYWTDSGWVTEGQLRAAKTCSK